MRQELADGEPGRGPGVDVSAYRIGQVHPARVAQPQHRHRDEGLGDRPAPVLDIAARHRAVHTAAAYVADLQASARATLQNLDPAPFFTKYGDNAWAIFKAYPDAASAQAAAPETQKYLGKLAAADVFTFDNAFAVIESLRIDGGVLGPFGDHP